MPDETNAIGQRQALAALSIRKHIGTARGCSMDSQRSLNVHCCGADDDFGELILLI